MVAAWVLVALVAGARAVSQVVVVTAVEAEVVLAAEAVAVAEAAADGGKQGAFDK